MPGPKSSSPNVLLVEGRNDQEFIYQLTNRAGIARGSYSIPTWEGEGGGFETLVSSLPGFLAGSDIQRLGIVVDADEDPIAHWNSVTSKLRSTGYVLPPGPSRSGLIHSEPGKPVTVGLWLMPDNESPGMIEDLVAALILADDRLWRRAAEAIDRIPGDERRFRPSYATKARVHTWLAWQEEPGTPMGLAVQRQYLDGSAPLASEFVSWLKRLFGLT